MGEHQQRTSGMCSSETSSGSRAVPAKQLHPPWRHTSAGCLLQLQTAAGVSATKDSQDLVRLLLFESPAMNDRLNHMQSSVPLPPACCDTGTRGGFAACVLLK